MRSSKGKWFSLLLAGLMVMSLGLLAGCSSDDKNACEDLCKKVCDKAVQCGAIPAGSCTSSLINQCVDAANANGGNDACKDGLDDPLSCNMF